jgi:hypothetical protein
MGQIGKAIVVLPPAADPYTLPPIYDPDGISLPVLIDRGDQRPRIARVQRRERLLGSRYLRIRQGTATSSHGNR